MCVFLQQLSIFLEIKWDRTVSNVIFSLFKYTFLYSRHKKTHEYILTTPHEKEVYLHKAYLLTAWTGTAITYLTSAHQFFLIYQFWGILGIVEICKTANSVDFFFFPVDKELQSSDVVNLISFTSTKDKFWLTFDNFSFYDSFHIIPDNRVMLSTRRRAYRETQSDFVIPKAGDWWPRYQKKSLSTAVVSERCIRKQLEQIIFRKKMWGTNKHHHLTSHNSVIRICS